MTITCQQFEARLPDYLEGELQRDDRDAFERHADACPQCYAVLDDVRAIVASAGALGPIEPSRDLWSGIESRIGAPVVPLTARLTAPLIRRLAAAVVLVAATAGITYQLTVARRSPSPAVVSSQSPASAAVIPGDPPGDATAPAAVGGSVPPVATTLAEAAVRPDATPRILRGAGVAGVASSEPANAGGSTVRAVRSSARAIHTAAIYDREIALLHATIRARRAQLDPKTVAAIERSLSVIDTAIAQARAALEADPASRFLHGRLTDVLDKKVELLRTTAMLPARS